MDTNNDQKDVVDRSTIQHTNTMDPSNNETVVERQSQRTRICLVGSVAKDHEVREAAQLFKVPVESSETGEEFIGDDSWITYFILSDFEGQIFDSINKAKTKHRILGPPALLTASTSPDGLPLHNRPIYNYSLKNAVIAFTGIRKRDELTQLVHLIHFMGGSIRKELNHRATHLICSNAFGDKYRYALTFRLNVVRSSWVMNAWMKRNEIGFCAKDESFTADHRLKIFEGCRVAFIGFPEHERLNMVDLLRSYNGVETSRDDETCTHKIIADCPVFANDPNNETFDNTVAFIEDDLEENEDDVDANDYASQVIQRKHDSILRQFEQNENQDNNLFTIKEDESAKSRLEQSNLLVQSLSSTCVSDRDGAILHKDDDANNFSVALNISPILKTEEPKAVEDDHFPEDSFRESIKRKRAQDDSIDNVSLMSVDSSKKPKLLRAGSLTKNLRRRMSFSVVQPINNLFRSRHNSVDPNSSSCSNFERSFNESIKEPIKEKFRAIKDKMSKFNKKDFSTPKSAKAKMRMASANIGNMQDVCTLKTTVVTPEKFLPDTEFKTPKAVPFISTSSVSKSLKFRSKLDDSARNFETVTDMLNATAESKLVVDEGLRYDQAATGDDPKYYVVKAEWFWTRIAEGYAPEDDFLYKDYMQSVKDEQAEQCERRDSLINYSAKAQRKRKRLSRIVLDGTPASAGKRRSSISDAGLLSESLIDYTASPDKNESVKEDVVNDYKKFSMRHNHFMDFYHTESNYVGILETIFKLFKVPLEKMAEENPEQSDLLNKSEVKSIFSNFLPIYLVHKKMLNSLQEINAQWTEDVAIGQIILENRDSLLKAYPPYVNFFEQMRETLTQCAQSKPRFQAFLKINQAKPECGRQSLQELMIRPVQRLPSISLLLNDILKHTPKTNRDHELLVESLTAIKEVMKYINEDKRKTEGQTQMFNIFNEIENCPPHLVSSHRSFVSRCEVTELSDTLSGRGDSLMLFLFTDSLEICKKRSGFNKTKSPNSMRIHKSSVKPYKHIKLIPLSSIRTLADISDSPRAFALSLRNSSSIQDFSKDKVTSFSISDEEVDKTIYIKNFCKQLAENACRTDSEKFLVSVLSQEISIDIDNVHMGSMSKAFRMATRRMKVGRVFSFNKTPSRKRNIGSPFGSNTSLTPSTISSLSHLKLQSSCMTLNELDMERKESNDQLKLKCENMAPLTDQMTRKNKKPSDSHEI